MACDDVAVGSAGGISTTSGTGASPTARWVDAASAASFALTAALDATTNLAAALITSKEEREQLAERNLVAGKRAKDSTAYNSALKYLTAGAALLGDDAWKFRHELIFSMESNRAECEFLTGQLEAADERLTMLSSRAANTIELADTFVDTRADPHLPEHLLAVSFPYIVPYRLRVFSNRVC